MDQLSIHKFFHRLSCYWIYLIWTSISYFISNSHRKRQENKDFQWNFVDIKKNYTQKEKQFLKTIKEENYILCFVILSFSANLWFWPAPCQWTKKNFEKFSVNLLQWCELNPSLAKWMQILLSNFVHVSSQSFFSDLFSYFHSWIFSILTQLNTLNVALVGTLS